MFLTGPTFVDVMLARAGVLGLFADGGDPGGGGGGGTPAPIDGGQGGGGGDGFTPPQSQAELDRIIQNRLAKQERQLLDKFSDYDELKEQVSQLGELRQAYEELRDKSDKRPEAEKELEKMRKRLESTEKTAAERERAIKERDELIAKERAERQRVIQDHGISAALNAAKVYSGAADDALASFRKTAEFDVDEESGEITAIHLTGQTFQSLEEAAKKFLELKPHFAAASVGGAGTRRPNGMGGPQDPGTKRASDLIASGLRDANPFSRT